MDNKVVDLNTIETFAIQIKNFLPDILAAVLVFAVGMLISKIILGLVKSGIKRSRLDPTVHSFFISLLRICLDVIVAVIALSVLGVPMASIIAVIGAAGLAVGLALQNSLSNLAGGFIILLSKPFKKGDYILSNGTEGFVDSISILYTRILTVDNKVVYIPNGSVSGSLITNFSQEETRRVDITFSIAYENNFEKAKQVILDVIDECKEARKSPEPLVRVVGHGDSAIQLTTRVWVDSADYWTVYFYLNERVKTAFDENGITIPYNQLDVHLADEKSIS